jgi:hypothetical protein
MPTSRLASSCACASIADASPRFTCGLSGDLLLVRRLCQTGPPDRAPKRCRPVQLHSRSGATRAAPSARPKSTEGIHPRRRLDCARRAAIANPVVMQFGVARRPVSAQRTAYPDGSFSLHIR